MTNWHITFIDYSLGVITETIVRNAPDRDTAVSGALKEVPNNRYHDPIMIVPEYLH